MNTAKSINVCTTTIKISRITLLHLEDFGEWDDRDRLRTLTTNPLTSSNPARGTSDFWNHSCLPSHMNNTHLTMRAARIFSLLTIAILSRKCLSGTMEATHTHLTGAYASHAPAGGFAPPPGLPPQYGYDSSQAQGESSRGAVSDYYNGLPQGQQVHSYSHIPDIAATHSDSPNPALYQQYHEAAQGLHTETLKIATANHQQGGRPQGGSQAVTHTPQDRPSSAQQGGRPSGRQPQGRPQSAEEYADMRRQLDTRWKQIDKFESSVKA
ncbi:hypothetical protein AZE42_09244 [Rhizopogon vesiculosus]|uniref:Uncharacterized protein n=1 Tax=Rhizopogon vesiculosus TaxID=180088 RepID=A0A1J8QHJ5_9AGAM|nr:hypothetical protein AZE42_09244 [Rhizopogon vesiculosus]